MENYKQGVIKNFHQKVKSRNAGRERRLLFVKDKHGNLFGDEKKIMER